MAEPRRACPAPAAALAGAQWWDLAVQAARATPRDAIDHADLYDLAAELVATLRSLEDLATVIARSSRAYAERDDLRDDEDADPQLRLATAADGATATRSAIAAAISPANAFWSAIGHIGRQHDPSP